MFMLLLGIGVPTARVNRDADAVNKRTGQGARAFRAGRAESARAGRRYLVQCKLPDDDATTSILYCTRIVSTACVIPVKMNGDRYDKLGFRGGSS